MNMKISHVAFAMIACTSFSAAAIDSVVAGTAVAVDAAINVSAPSAVGLTITPASNVSLSDIKKGDAVLGNFTVTGTNAAVRMVDQDAVNKQCTMAKGSNNAANTLLICMNINATDIANSFEDAGFKYYKYADGTKKNLRTYEYNKYGDNPGADTYKFTMEVVNYTI
ncbi:hypothetical protein GL270_09410 [Aeromonas veronii]|uniref:hypothetical protein n=1 Tax=Aeromonas veronii TaxID=654 RepID=UPI001C5B9A22|nr:hypothetical protein [Aeromonas veronii]MBW3781456.1 hypothetical protein [Aeromonas veronii]